MRKIKHGETYPESQSTEMVKSVLKLKSDFSDREKQILYDPTCMWNLRKKLTEIEVRLVFSGGRCWGVGNWIKVVQRYKLPVIR